MGYLKKETVFDSLSAMLGMTSKERIDKLCEDYKGCDPSHPKRLRGRMQRLHDEWLFRNSPEPEPEDTGPIISGVIEAPEDVRGWAPGTTFVFTSAQANTFINEKFWASLMHLVEDKKAQLHISRFTYNKQTYGKNSVKPGSHEESDDDSIWFDPRIEPYVSDEQLQIADDLIWCGELNIIPTRIDPLYGFDNYGRGASVIVPHTRMAMKSIPTMKNDPARFSYSTGTVTARNYIEKAAGQRASLHHVYGALLVELDENGQWWARQLNADNDGNVYDLDSLWTPDGISPERVATEVLTHGDLHGNKLNLDVARIMSDVIDHLMPKHQVFHDTIDFQPRNHHNIKDPHFLHEMHTKGSESVEAEFEYISEMMKRYFARNYSKHWIVTSNHDQAVEGWLRNVQGFHDPVNMELWLRMNHYCARWRQEGIKPRPFAHMLFKFLAPRFHWSVIHEDDSLVIAGIEHALHGHIGPNGARGSPKNLRSAGKANTAHTHSAGIIEGTYTAGVEGDLDMGYNKGLSSWSHSFIVTYPNGKRTICTIKDGKAWR